MPEEVSNSTSDYLTDSYSILSENERFLREHAPDSLDEIIKLIIDSIDAVELVVKSGKGAQLYSQSCMAFFSHHILMPYSYAIYSDLHAGNLPVCFMQLRVILESLTKCYLADTKYPEETFFQSKLDLLNRNSRDSISKMASRVGDAVGLNNRLKVMWNRLSNAWVHTRGIAEGLVQHITEKEGFPPWSLVLPTAYNKDNLGAIDELRKEVAEFRVFLKTVMDKSHNLFAV